MLMLKNKMKSREIVIFKLYIFAMTLFALQHTLLDQILCFIQIGLPY